ncbi:response regulator [Steroidobacter sp. S1-65]|uniref:histidine kinase n=1 Tax=Steroidobacter gossypii TaxID=2805490 RepID=A0ABS1WWZ1_9GAMM|nr:ATP-binding protein [Steroidobacter gossypii]MBM0105496.1 response regulator [Steroidobacter gossypii]
MTPFAFNNQPLQRRLLLLVALAAAGALLLAVAVAAVYESTTYRPRTIAEAHEQVQSIASIVTAAVEFEDARTANQYLNALGRDPDIEALAILLEGGVLFAEYRRPGTQPVDFADPTVRDQLVAAGHILTSYNIGSQGRPRAELWMAMLPRPLAHRLLEYAALLGAVALSLLALAIMLSITLRRAFSEPVQALATTARDVTRLRDYRRRVAITSNDEVGQLARDFNAMLDAVEERERALEHSEETARRQLIEIEAIYANAQVGLCVIDRELRYVRANKHMGELTGQPITALIGRTLEEATPALAITLAPICRQVLETGEPVADVEFQTGAATDGFSQCWIGNHHALLDELGNIIGVNVVFHDITERKRADKQRAVLEAQLRQAQKMEALGTLAGGIAHDFNNVLTAISGNAQLAIEDLSPNHPAAVSLHEIKRATSRARDLVRGILAFSRPEQNIQHLIDLRPVVEEALRLLRAAVPRMIEMRLEAEPDLPAVMADATQVHQVLMNLGKNACDAMQAHGGTLTIRLASARIESLLDSPSPDVHPGHYLRISVADTGTGIPPEALERVFEPFFTTKAHGEGTGLGLSVVHGIVRGHRGAILVRSEPGAGTVFDVYLPAADRKAAEVSQATAPAAVTSGRGERVLYVDDEDQLVHLVTRMMERMGYKVTGMTRPMDAIDAVRADPRRFDLVLSDLGMPGMSGMDLAEELLQIRPDLPIIITSGYVRSEDERRAEQIGVRDVVMKPNTVAEIGQLIRDRLDALRRP